MQVEGKQVLPLDPETARANCALILALLFTGRVVNRFGILKFPRKFACHLSPAATNYVFLPQNPRSRRSRELYVVYDTTPACCRIYHARI